MSAASICTIAQFEPIFQAAVDLNVPLFVHPADPLGKDRTQGI